jgi:hypothetical protein
MKSLEQGLSHEDNKRLTTKDRVSNESEVLMQEFNSLADNIAAGVKENNAIRKELKDRNVTLYPDIIDLPGPSTEDFD